MSVTTTTPAGRIKLLHPDLNHIGGVTLWEKIHEIYSRIGDSVTMQWHVTEIPASQHVIYLHNYDTPLNLLTVRVFEGDTLATPDTFTVTQESLNSIRITNISGVTKTFNFYVFALSLQNLFNLNSAITKTLNSYVSRRTISIQCNSICYAKEKGMFVYVGNTGSLGRQSYSYDSHFWDQELNATVDAFGWSSVTYSPSLDRFVAVASSGTGSRIMHSNDGKNWVLNTSITTTQEWSSVIWNPFNSRFIAVARSGTNRAMYSNDGLTWSTVNSANESNSWGSLAVNPSNGVTAAVAMAGSGNRIMISTNGGLSWQLKESSNDDINWGSIGYSPFLNKFLAVAASNSSASVCHGDGDGDSFTEGYANQDGLGTSFQCSSSSGFDKRIIWLDDLKMFFVALSTPSGMMGATSYDGVTFELRPSGVAALRMCSVTYDEDRKILIGGGDLASGTLRLTANRPLHVNDLFYP